MKINECEKVCEGRRLRSGKEVGPSSDDICKRALFHWLDHITFSIWSSSSGRKCLQCGYGLAIIKFVHKYHEALRTSSKSMSAYEEFGKRVRNMYEHYRYKCTYDTCTCGYAYTQPNPTQPGYTYIYHQLEDAVKLFDLKHCLDFK